MKDNNQHAAQIQILAFFGLISLTGILLVVSVLRIPGDEKGSVFLGLSLARLLLVGIMTGGSLAAAVYGIYAGAHPNRAEQLKGRLKVHRFRQFIAFVGIALCMCGLIALLTPGWFGKYAAYFVRFRPMLVWFGWIGLQVAVVLLLPGACTRIKNCTEEVKRQGLLRPILLIAGIFSLLTLLVRFTGIGITSDQYYWNEAAVPVLGVQVLLSLGVAFIVNRLVFSRMSGPQRTWLEIATVIGIWGFSFLLWQQTPMAASYFAPGPYLPSNDYFPYSDAALYDVAGQYILLGRGLANQMFMDKPLYSLLLSLFHAVAGQAYQPIITLQVALLAALPVGMYFLGKNLFNPFAGLLAALLATFQQRNAIAATQLIQVSHSKLMMTEYPTALVLVLTCLAAVVWLKSPWGQPVKALWAGGLAGLAILIRPNSILAIALVAIVVIFSYRRYWRKMLVGLGLFTFVLAVTVTPWLLEVPVGYNEPILLVKIKAIIRTRYNLPAEDPQGQISPKENERVQVNLSAAAPLMPINGLSDEISNDSPLVFIPRHFVHNEVMAFFTLPDTLFLKTLPETLQSSQWTDIKNWDGGLPWDAVLMVGVNVVILSIGLATCWRRWRIVGWVPLFVQIGYYAANALVRNSGARYLVPVDWVFLLYYAVGLVMGISWILRILGLVSKDTQFLSGSVEIEEKNTLQRFAWGKAAGISAGFLAIGLLIPNMAPLVPDRYPEIDKAAVMNSLAGIEELNLDATELSAFIENPDSRAWIGRGLYPRYYWANKGEPLAYYAGNVLATPLQKRDYARFTLTLLSPQSDISVVLPYQAEWDGSFPNGADLAVFGCWNNPDYYLDALAVVVLSDPPQVFKRFPQAPLSCPAPLPLPPPQ